MNIKKSNFAGSWYPETAEGCQNDIEQYCSSSTKREPTEKEYFAAISPHAGWYFSGGIACNTIKLLKGKINPDIVVIFGKHLHSTSPATVLVDGLYATPLGKLDVAEQFSLEMADKLSLKKESANSYIPENTIELQLPFIKYFFGDVKIAIIGVPPSKIAFEIGEAVVDIAKKTGNKIKVVGSTDMTHYGENFGFTPAGTGERAVEWVKSVNDKSMIDAMIKMDELKVLEEASKNFNACCSGAVAATIVAARGLGAGSGNKTGYATSYDLSPGSSFVGYAGVVY